MHPKHAIRAYFIYFWLALSAGWSGTAVADSYAEAEAALADGDYRGASRLFKRLARQDEPRAQYRLGLLYLAGQGVEADVAQGIEWLKRAAGNGSYRAANELGQIYLTGRGVAVDEQEAGKWVELATRLASPNATEAGDDCE